jgi:UDPglucose--hexose-1-phosphate uridylyltransferase
MHAMSTDGLYDLKFERQTILAKFVDPSGRTVEKPIEIRTHPISGRTCRITFSRSAEKEAGAESLPNPPPNAGETSRCPFCRPRVHSQTPQLHPDLLSEGRMVKGESLLFPNLFPYGSYSAVSLFNDDHFVEIGKASVSSYADSFMNAAAYLEKVIRHDSQAVYTAVTQNHLPSAGGSLLHPHLQINADRIPANHHRFLLQKSADFHRRTDRYLFSEYLAHEKAEGSRCIGATGQWQWVAAFAPEGFFEIWGILPGIASFRKVTPAVWQDLARGVINTQRFYRSLCRNGYNLGLLAVETPASRLELRVVMVVRSNYAPWVRSDYTGFEVMLGDMATFVAPEQTADWARPFFKYRL